MTNLINLTGSEKQIRWAEDIRTRFFAANADEPSVAILATVADSRFWIETRAWDGWRLAAICKGLEQGESWFSIAKELR